MSEERQVYGWMNEEERLALRRWGFGLKVLEVGCYEGLSTMQFATTAEHITVIDTFDGRATPAERDTEEAFHLNMRACGATEKIFAIKGESHKVMPKLERNFDLVFIDANHSYEFVSEDARLARQILKAGGSLAFHDYNIQHPGVLQTVSELVQDGMYPVEQADSLVMLKEGPKPAPVARSCQHVALLYPSYNGWLMHSAPPSKKYSHTIFKGGTSIITVTFNKLLTEVMNSKDYFTYLAMCHADIVPDMHWIDTLIEELEANNLDMISAVVPIKNQRGTTSTGLEVTGTQWAVRRLTMNEIFDEWKLPPTFKATDVPGRTQGQGLMLNSGLWLMRWDRPWRSGLHFRQQDRIMWSISEEKFGAESVSEDWDWSRQMISRGCRLGATTKVQLIHERPEFHNHGAWGTWKTDEAFFNEQAVIEAQRKEAQDERHAELQAAG